MRDANLQHFRKSKESPEEMLGVIKKFGEGDYEVHKIPVEHGELRVVVENGVPTITFLTEKRVVLETLNTNTLKLIAF